VRLISELGSELLLMPPELLCRKEKKPKNKKSKKDVTELQS